MADLTTPSPDLPCRECTGQFAHADACQKRLTSGHGDLAIPSPDTRARIAAEIEPYLVYKNLRQESADYIADRVLAVLCPDIDTTAASTDDLVARLERLASKYDNNHLTDHARGVRQALREVQSFFAPVRLR